jgi:hypothetical protein
MIVESGNVVEYSWRGADVNGRRLRDHQYEARFSVSSRFEGAYDRHKIRIRGVDRANWFDVRTSGYEGRYGWAGRFGQMAGYFEYRNGHGMTNWGGTVRLSPRVATYTVGGTLARPLSGRLELNTVSSLSKVDCGSGGAWSWRLGAGLDYCLWKDIVAQANALLYTDTGDVSGTEWAFSTGLHYEDQSGFVADIFGVFLPSGVPLAGEPMSDASAFSLDPLFLSEPRVAGLHSEGVGYYMFRLGYITRF